MANMDIKDKHEAIGFINGYDKAIKDILNLCEKEEGEAYKIVGNRLKEFFDIDD